MVIAGHVGLSRDRSWPRLLTRNSYRLPVSSSSQCSLRKREGAGSARKDPFQIQDQGRLPGDDLRAVTPSATLRRPCAWLLLEFLAFLRIWWAVSPAFSYIRFACRLHGLVCLGMEALAFPEYRTLVSYTVAQEVVLPGEGWKALLPVERS